MLSIDLSHLTKKVDLGSYKDKVAAIDKMINDKTGLGNDYLGWAEYPNTYDKKEFEEIKKWAKVVRDNYEVLLVCGIGGSYLGARAAIEAINGLHAHDKLEIIFVGQTFSGTYIEQVYNYVKNKKFAINVISKSGTTTETSISFRIFRKLLEEKLGKKEAAKAIFATTDKEKGALKTEATKEGYVTFVLPSDVGGRFSVLTAVGLFPIACAGINIDEMMAGAKEAHDLYKNPDLKTNPCYQYAVARHALYSAGLPVEMFVTYEPQYVQIGEWFKQLFGESEGKEHKALLPDSATFSTDLHSLGQYIQDGSPIMFETILYVKHHDLDPEVVYDEEDLDGLNYIAGKKMSYVCEKAFLGTLEAHEKTGGVSNIIIEMDKLGSKELGHLFYFFFRACAMSAYLLDINPFNQPGVEVYKKNMFHLLGKKGY